jgi:Predicted nucleotide-binding protein containing TIR-like domain
MKIRRLYRHNGPVASKLGTIRDYLNSTNSASLGDQWAHRVWGYRLDYSPEETVECANFDEVRSVVNSRGDTRSHVAWFESETGRMLRVDTTDPTRITVEADNKDRTLPFLARIEELLDLKPLPKRVFVSHGRSTLWLEVQRFIERDAHLDLEVVELAEEPNRGRSISRKLAEESNQCSFAVIMMTGDDIASDDETRVRENVMHEIGFFQARYGFERVCLLREEGVNIPSNLDGIGYSGFPKGQVKSAFVELLRELRAAFET